jgi:hypothetical protein
MKPLIIPSFVSSTLILYEIGLPSSRCYQIVVHRPLPYSWIERERVDVSVRLYGRKVHEEYSKTEWNYLPTPQERWR